MLPNNLAFVFIILSLWETSWIYCLTFWELQDFSNVHYINWRRNVVVFTSEDTDISRQCVRLLSIPFYLLIYFAISSQVTKASSEVCSSTTLPNPMESLERNTPHYKLPPTCLRPTPLCKTPLKWWNNLFGRGGIWGHVEHYHPRWIRGSNANCPSSLRDSCVGNHLGSDIRRQNS